MTEEILPPWVQKINAGRKGDRDIYGMFFYMMKELHLSYEDLLNMPVPAIMVLSEELSEHAKREQKAMKKRS